MNKLFFCFFLLIISHLLFAGSDQVYALRAALHYRRRAQETEARTETASSDGTGFQRR